MCLVKRDKSSMNIHDGCVGSAGGGWVRVMLTSKQKKHSSHEQQQVSSCQHADETQHPSNKQHDHAER